MITTYIMEIKKIFIILILSYLSLFCLKTVEIDKYGREIKGKETVVKKPSGEFYAADNDSIYYYGRVDLDDEEAKFDFPGINIIAGFEGTSCTVYLVDGGNDYNIFIDNEFKSVLVTKPEVQIYKVAKGLKDGKHTIKIVKRTEASYGIAVFKGLILDKGKKLFKVSDMQKRKIEFIGDSITCGYGNEGPSINCDSLRKYENVSKAYGPVTAEGLNAEYNIIAISGKGVVRNYGDKSKISPDPVSFYYRRTLQNISDNNWDFTKWVPDLVVIALGANDFSTEPHPDKDVFENEYKKFVSFIRKNYRNAKILILNTHPDNEAQKKNLENVYNKLKNDGVKDIYYFDLPLYNNTEVGCDYHPLVNVHKRFTDSLAPYIKQIMGW